MTDPIADALDELVPRFATVEENWRGVLAAVAATPHPARGSRRRFDPRRRWVIAALASAVVLVGVGAFLLGSTFAVKSASGASGDAPGFLPAPGWTEVSTGTVPLTGGPAGPGPTVIAVNGRLSQEDGPVGTFPTQTLSTLPPDGIVFYVVIGSASDGGPNFPPRALPLQLSDATVLPSWEGMPSPNVLLYRIDAAANGYILSAYVFFGTQNPSPQLIRTAQEELDRLQVPAA